MKKILVATDLSSRSDRAVLKAIKLAKNYNARLIIASVIDQEMPKHIIDNLKQSAVEEISLCIKSEIKTVKHEIRILVGNPHLELLTIAANENVDLIILGTHRHVPNKIQPIIGKVIERIIKNTHKPVLIVKNRPETDYKDILVGVDFNIHSEKSLKLALSMFKGSNFHLIHSYQMPYLGIVGDMAQLESDARAVSSSDLDEMIKKVTKSSSNKTNSKYKITKIIKSGYSENIIKEEIADLKPQLLVLGTHGRSGLQKFMHPSIAESFLIDPACDILVVM